MDHLSFCLKKFTRLYPHLIPLISQVKPAKLRAIDAKEWVANLDLEGIQDLFVYGIGKGEIYEVLKNWLGQKINRLLFFIEEDVSVLRALFETDVGSRMLMDDQVEILHFFPEEPAPLFQRLMWQGVLRKRVVVGDPRALPDSFQKVQNILKFDQDKIDWTSKDYQVFGLGYYYNYYKNLKQLPECHDGTSLFGKLKNVPAIIVGAGPSLNKNGHLLAKIREKALIFAGGSALPGIKQFNIKPHFGGGIDPNITQVERIKSYGVVDFPFLFCSRFNALAFNLLKGPKVYIPGTGGYDTAPWINKQLGLPKVTFEEGYSIIHFMTEIAYHMGCNPIVYIGVDLSYPNNVHYAHGITQPEEMPNDLIQTVDIHRKPIASRWMWLKEALWISEFANRHPEIKVINATEGGIGYKDVPNKPFNQVIQTFKENYDFDSLLKYTQLNIQEDQIPKIIHPLVESLKRISKLLEEIRSYYQKVDLIHYKREEITFPEGADWYEKLEAELAFDPIVKIFHSYCINLISNSHTFYLAARDGLNSKIVKQVLQLQIQKVNYLLEVVKGQIDLLDQIYPSN